jgi:hypothetical protein
MSSVPRVMRANSSYKIRMNVLNTAEHLKLMLNFQRFSINAATASTIPWRYWD